MAAAGVVFSTFAQSSFRFLKSTSVDCQDRCSVEVMMGFARSTEVRPDVEIDAVIDAGMC